MTNRFCSELLQNFDMMIIAGENYFQNKLSSTFNFFHNCVFKVLLIICLMIRHDLKITRSITEMRN